MSNWLSERERRQVLPAFDYMGQFPIPTRNVGNGEYMPFPQTAQQREVEARIAAAADEIAPRLGMDRRKFLKSSMGLAASFTAMNSVFGDIFSVAHAQTIDEAAGVEWAAQFANQFIFDGHLHFVSDEFANEGFKNLRNYAHYIGASELEGVTAEFEHFQFENFVKEVFLDSDTTVGILTSATSDNPANVFLTNEQVRAGVDRLNRICGSRRLLAHAMFEPGKPGWINNVERAIEELNPASWKGYTVGDPFGVSAFAYRLDDEDLMYPFYARTLEAGITNICVHKGLMPPNYEEALPGIWEHATVADVGKAAQDWPDLNFIIYHAALQPSFIPQPDYIQAFEETGRMNWVSDLAEIPERFGVSNVYADLGTSFGTTCVTYPRHAAAMVATLVKGLGLEHVLWGTDAVWYGSPHWQIEAFRRIEVPEDLATRFDLELFGDPRSATRDAILGLNSARLYDFHSTESTVTHYAGDDLSAARAAYRAEGADPSNVAYGFINAG